MTKIISDVPREECEEREKERCDSIPVIIPRKVCSQVERDVCEVKTVLQSLTNLTVRRSRLLSVGRFPGRCARRWRGRSAGPSPGRSAARRRRRSAEMSLERTVTWWTPRCVLWCPQKSVRKDSLQYYHGYSQSTGGTYYSYFRDSRSESLVQSVPRQECVGLPTEKCDEVEREDCQTECKDVFWCEVCHS